MASTSLAQQLQKLGTPHTKLYVSKNKKVSLLFDSKEAASIDKISIYEIGVGGLDELIELNDKFAEFKNSLFDETSKNFERAVETSEINKALDELIKKFLCLLSPYFLLKPSQKALEWLISRFHIHDYNTNELVCAALPYHGTLLFSRLLQVLDLQNEKNRWHWLYPLQRKGVPLSKETLYDRCVSDTTLLKMIAEFVVDCVQTFGDNVSKLTTLFAFYGTTAVATLHNMQNITDLHLTYLLPSIWYGLSSESVDYISSTFLIISTILTKNSIQEKLHRKFVEKIVQVDHVELRGSIVLSLNILYQYRDLETSIVPKEALRTLQRKADWFIPELAKFLSSGSFPNVFFFALTRDALRLARNKPGKSEGMEIFAKDLIISCRVDDSSAKILIRVVVEECRESDALWCCELVQNLERQYPTLWDNVIVDLLNKWPSGSLSHVFGFTSIKSQMQLFEKLNHVEPSVRVEAINWIADNAHIVETRFLESSLVSQWHDDDPKIIEAMFKLPEKCRYYTPVLGEKLLLKCWHESTPAWNNVLLQLVAFLKTENVIETNESKYTVLLLPFLFLTNYEIRTPILEIDLPIFRAIKRNLKMDIHEAFHKTLKNQSILPKIEELIGLFDEYSNENVCVFTLLLLLSASYKVCNHESKMRALTCIFEQIFPVHFKRFKWKKYITWDQTQLTEYYQNTAKRVPLEIVHHLLICILENTSVPKKLLAPGWCDFLDQQTSLVSSLYNHLSRCSQSSDEPEDVTLTHLFIEKHLAVLQERINFLCNMCLLHKEDEFTAITAFHTINSSLKKTTESFSWALKLTSDNTIIPTILICSYSTDSRLRRIVMETVDVFCASFGSAISDEVTFIEFFKHLSLYKEEIILDREQLTSVLYGFFSQDRAVQDLLEPGVRIVTKKVFNAFFDLITCEKVPIIISASLLPIVDVFQDTNTLYKLIRLAKRILDGNNHPNEDESAVVSNIIEKLSANVNNLFDEDEPRNFLHFCLENCLKIKIMIAKNETVCLGSVLLRHLSVTFDLSSKDTQTYLLNSILKILVDCENTYLVVAANSFMKKITLDTHLIIPYLEKMKTVDLKEMVSSTKPRQLEWRIGIALLEIIQNKKKLKNVRAILPLLFDVLQNCCEVDEQIAMEYAKQLCLSCILTCCQKLISEIDDNDDRSKKAMMKKLRSSFKVELVVNCIRMSPNSQTHHHALMLLGYCATFAPDQVLHNVMAIFTFMGSSVLRQDDAFSFQIISNILDTIVPLLVRSEQESVSLYKVLRVFAASIPDIPDHRRVPLLVRLLKILNDGEYVHVLILFGLESAAKNGAKSIELKYTEALSEVLLAMSVRQTLECVQKLLIHANSLPHNIDGNTKNILTKDSIFDVKTFKHKELHHFKYLLLNFASNMLSNSEFVQKVSKVDTQEKKSMNIFFRGIIEQAIMYIRTASEYCSKEKTASAKYWKVMTSQGVEVLNKTNALLLTGTFLKIAKNLIVHKSPIVQRKTLELLNWRLQQSRGGAETDQFKTDKLVTIIPILMEVISGTSENASDDSNDVKLNQQTALISIKLLVKYFYSSEFTIQFKKTLSKLSALLSKTTGMSDHVLACLVLTIAELTSSLKVHAIEVLPKFVPEFLLILKRYQTQEFSQNDVLLLSITIAIQKLVEALPNFLSPYLESILYEITCINARVVRSEVSKTSTNDDSRNSSITHKIKIIGQKLAEISSRVLLPSVSACFERLCETRNFDALKLLMDILTDSFPQNGHFSPELTSLFFKALDFRSTYRDNLDEKEISLVEGTIIEGLSQIILKCSETTFRPFYHKLYDWCVIASKEASKKYRIITYYRILSIISEKLKGIFVLFASNFLRNAAELLQKNNVSCEDQEVNNSAFSNDETISLVDSILKTLANVFRYDSVKFLTKDRFDMLCEPLVNQIVNTIGDYSSRSQEIIIPCLARFASATTDDSLLKQFNYSILLKTRHASPEVRLAALDTVVTFATNLGDNFLPFLPETVPFLTELLEDENEIVEKQTHKAVQKLEEVLEEPIQKYF